MYPGWHLGFRPFKCRTFFDFREVDDLHRKTRRSWDVIQNPTQKKALVPTRLFLSKRCTEQAQAQIIKRLSGNTATADGPLCR
jgi:hypothetical protein